MNAKLTPKQEKFCHYYIETGNASDAYRRVFACSNMKDKTVWEKASLLLNKDKVRTRVEEIKQEFAAKSDITKERVIEELKAIAFSDIRDYVIFDGVMIRFKSFDELTDSQAKAIEGIKQGKSGIELTLHGKSWGISRICKMLGFDEPTQVNLKNLLVDIDTGLDA